MVNKLEDAKIFIFFGIGFIILSIFCPMYEVMSKKVSFIYFSMGIIILIIGLIKYKRCEKMPKKMLMEKIPIKRRKTGTIKYEKYQRKNKTLKKLKREREIKTIMNNEDEHEAY